MATPSEPKPPPASEPAPPAPPKPARGSLTLRRPVSTVQSILLGIASILIVFGVWWIVTRGPDQERIISPLLVPSPAETLAAFPVLYYENDGLNRNIVITLYRVVLGFCAALVIGVPLGILAGCFPRFGAMLAPLVMFGRNIPLQGIMSLLIAITSAGEGQKIAFIFFACVAFVIADTERAIREVAQRYVDTAFTLGASRWQTITKVLIPLAMPSIVSSARLLFGLAFGYIMLIETTAKFADVPGGLGYLIATFQRKPRPQYVYLIVLIIPLIALVIDQTLYWIQRSLFPHQYGGAGALNSVVRSVLHTWEDFKQLFRSKPAVAAPPEPATSAEAKAESEPEPKPSAASDKPAESKP